MTSFQGAEEINICLNRLDDFQPEIKPFLLSNKALHSRQALANAAAPLTGPLPSPNAAQAARHCSLHLPRRHSRGDTQGEGRRLTPLRNGAAGCCLWQRRGLRSWTCLPKGQRWSLRDPLIHRMLHLALFAQEKEGQKKRCDLVVVMKNPSQARIKEQHNPELESRQCCPYSRCSRHRISPGDPLSMLGSGRRKFPVSLSTSLHPRPSHPHQALLTDHTPGPSPRRACDSQVHRQTKIQLWKLKTPKGISGGPNGKGTPSSCP